MKKKDELTGILSQAAQALRTSLMVCFLFTVLRALPLLPRKVFDNFWDGFNFKCPVKLQQLATGFKCLQIDNLEILKRVNREFDNFWLFGWKRSQQKAQTVLKKISNFNQKLSKVENEWYGATALYNSAFIFHYQLSSLST